MNNIEKLAIKHGIKVSEPLFTHPPATVPEGYALVPIEPTKEMLEKSWRLIDSTYSAVVAKDVYKAMLSASPTPPNAVPLEKYNKLLDAYRTIKKCLVDALEILEGEGVYPKTVEKIRQAIAEAEGKDG